MSFLSVVEQAVKSCKAEQAKINSNIQLYRELLRTLIPQPKSDSEESDSAEDAVSDTSPGEKEDIELLERALEKALQVRTGTGPSKKDSDRNKLPAQPKEQATYVVTVKEGKQTAAASKGNQTTFRSTSKSASLDRKEHKKPGASVSSSKAARKSQQAISKSGSLCQGQIYTSTLHSKNKTTKSELSGNETISTPSSSNTVAFSHTAASVAPSTPPQTGIAPDQTAKWKSLKSKQNRLWDRVVAIQRKPVPGRSHFMERMRATFPNDWPHSCPDQTRTLVDRLTHKGLDLTQRCRMKELLAKQTPEAAAIKPGGKKNKYDSCLTHKRLLMNAAEFERCADRTKSEWEAWDRWRPEGGCLCPTGANGVWGDGIIAHLPLTITYTSEAELREVEELRIRVAQLQQEIHFEQALLEALSPQLSSTIPGPGYPNMSVLRDMYSLLGEGGERFPAIVLDTESD
ncbi:tubulin epsilon and delta complex protein 2 isoform X1 [Labrus mixtus]|uniref:tubulin epsilon and delta complex protein 2 isoform X1 n=1 Tax=Labrus mixtus TaxID=508554 RepID=UPI0029C0782A|nr:tubulin epsilon and delta complex protein 2 isoform X1 [Labrus mixtus]